MAELMEQGSELVVGEQCWAVPYRSRKITHHIGHWNLQTLGSLTSYPAVVHPSSAAFMCPGIQIKKKAGDDFAITQQLEQLDVRVIRIKVIYFVNIDPIKTPHYLEQAGQNPVHRQVGPYVFLRHLVEVLT